MRVKIARSSPHDSRQRTTSVSGKACPGGWDRTSVFVCGRTNRLMTDDLRRPELGRHTTVDKVHRENRPPPFATLERGDQGQRPLTTLEGIGQHDDSRHRPGAALLRAGNAIACEICGAVIAPADPGRHAFKDDYGAVGIVHGPAPTQLPETVTAALASQLTLPSMYAFPANLLAVSVTSGYNSSVTGVSVPMAVKITSPSVGSYSPPYVPLESRRPTT